MPKQKLKKYSEVDNFPNVVHKDHKQKVKDFIANSKYVVLELACGKGEYTLEIARRNPDYKVLGLDVKGDRLWLGAKTGLSESLKNILFLRTHILDIAEIFPESSVDEIWITFPDPFLRDRDIKRRLTSQRFLERYSNILKEKNRVHLKTDDDKLFEFTKEIIKQYGAKDIEIINDVWSEGLKEDDVRLVKTYYEKKHLEEGKKIHYVSFSL